MIVGYYQTSLDVAAQVLFPIFASSGLLTQIWVPQRILNATVHFISTLREVLRGSMGKICLTWVDDIVMWPRDNVDKVRRLDTVLERLVDRGLYAAIHKIVLHRKEVK